MLLGVALLLTLTLREQLTALSFTALCRVASTTALVCYGALLARSRRGPWSIGALFGLLLLLFHFGDAIIVGANIPFSPDDAAYADLWLRSDLTSQALVACMVAMVAFSLAYAVATARRYPRGQVPPPPENLGAGRVYAQFGALLVASGVIAYIILLGSSGLLRGNGGDYFQFNRTFGTSNALSYAGRAISFGLIFAAAAPKMWARRAAMAAFLVYAMLLLPLGVRTAVLFPAAAGLISLARRHRTPSGLRALGVVLGGLTLVAFIRQFRIGGWAAVSWGSVNPLNSLAEFGGTLRTVTEVVRWRDVYHEGALGGLSYAAPFLRIGERLVGLPVPLHDERLPGTLLVERVPDFQIGFSPVAEAYLNFRMPGVVCVFLFLGFVVGQVDSMRSTSLRQAAFAGIVMAGLGLTVRNTFVSLPATVITGLSLLWVVDAIARSAERRAREERIHQPSRAHAAGHRRWSRPGVQAKPWVGVEAREPEAGRSLNVNVRQPRDTPLRCEQQSGPS